MSDGDGGTPGQQGDGRASGPTATRPPNVVLIITDQHRPDHTGFGGNPVVQTPHLDAIAARGLRFDKAIVANPICMPNRSTIMTGRMPSVHGVRFNGIALDWGANTFVRVLREHGYRTGLVGKAHFQNMGHLPGAASVFLGGEGDAIQRGGPDGWDEWENRDRHAREYVRFPADWYGFDHVDLVVDHSDNCSGHYRQWLLEQGVDPAALLGPEHRRQSVDVGWDQIYQPQLPEELYPTTYVGQRAVEFLEQAARADEPFFLQVSFPDPHHPFTPPGRYYERYDPADVPLPASFDDSLDGAMPHVRVMAKYRGKPPKMPVAPFACTETLYRQAAAKAYGMVTMIDDAVGVVLAALDRLCLADDTVIVFTSDHGDMFGDHGLMLKGGMHYEGCVRVPLVVAIPHHPSAGRATDALVSSIDLPETILSLCGAPEYFGMQGVDLRPVLDDPAATVRERVLVEEDELMDVLNTGRPLRMRTIVTPEGRLTRYEGVDGGEVYDHTDDPLELHNRFESPSAASDLQRRLTDELVTEMIRLADDSPRPTHFA